MIFMAGKAVAQGAAAGIPKDTGTRAVALIDSDPSPRSGTAGPAVQHRPRWRDALPTVATIVAVAVFVAAGNWQRGRMDAKEALRAQLDAARVMPETALPDGVAWDAWRYRPVRVEGTFDAARQFLVDNRVQGGRVGFHVVTPLVLTDGRVVLVDRGWIAAGATRDQLPAVPPAAGRVVVQGRVALPTSGYVELKADDGAGIVRQNLDPARFAAATGVPVLPVVIEATAPAAAEDAALVRDWPLPDAGADKHRIYMMQWYAFAALAAGLWLFFFVRRRRARHVGPGTGAPSPSP
jgi:surfeit locus 1 family protein